MATEPARAPYLRLVPGDVNGFLGLVVDNLSVLALLAAVLIGGFGVPAAIVFGRMFPGTALGVLVGDLVYTWLAVRLARRTGRNDVTAMPFGLDTPSTIGMVLLSHGVFSFGADARESYERMIRLVSMAEDYLAAKKAWNLPRPIATQAALDRNTIAALRRAVSNSALSGPIRGWGFQEDQKPKYIRQEWAPLLHIRIGAERACSIAQSSLTHFSTVMTSGGCR